MVPDPGERAQLAGRAMVVRKLTALPVEAVVRGYLIGSGYKDYRINGSVCGIALPPGLQIADRLPEPLFTPASKAPAGKHDENIDFDAMAKLVGRDHAGRHPAHRPGHLRIRRGARPREATSSSPTPSSNSGSTRRAISC